MKKVISFLPPISFQNSIPNKKDFEEKIIKFIQNNYIPLWDASGKKIDPKKIMEINTKFQAEEEKLINTLSTLAIKSNDFSNQLEIIKKTNFKYNNFLTMPEVYLFALMTMKTDFNGSSLDPEDWDIIYPRLFAARFDSCFKFPVANKPISDSIFKEKIISLEEAEKIYGTKMTTPRHETVIAGGDATRYLKALYNLRTALKNVTDPNMALDQDFFKKLIADPANEDVKGLFTTKKLSAILETPLFHFAGFNSNNVQKNEKGDYLAISFKNALVKTLKNINKDFAKALTYAYEISLGNKTYYFNYIMNSYLQTLMKVKEEGTKGNILYYMVKDKKNLNAVTKMLNILKSNGLIQPEILEIKLMDRTKDAFPVNVKTGQIFMENDKPKPTSTGHGPALIKAANEIIKDNNNKTISFSVRTVDNSGSDLAEYTAIGQNGCNLENELRDKIVEALDKNDKDLFFKIISEPKYAIKVEKYSQEKDLATLAKEFISNRWDFTTKKSTVEQIVHQIAKMPMTIAVVVSPRPEHKGGGLYVHKDLLLTAIVDKTQMSKEQESKKDFTFYFNPMLYTIYPKAPLTGELEQGTIFVAKKGTDNPYYQGESASTHLATEPTKTLKRTVAVPEKLLENAFLQQKTIDETTVSANIPLSNKIKIAVEYLAKELKKSPTEIAEIMQQAEESARLHIVK